MATKALPIVMAASVLFCLAGQGQGEGNSLSSPTTPVQFLRVDAGIHGQVKDDCIYIRSTYTGHTSLQPGDLRISRCQSYPAGSVVAIGHGDVGLQAHATTLFASFADMDGNGLLGAVDAVYLDTDANPGLAPTESAMSFTLRITGRENLTAGHFVRTYEDDALVSTKPMDVSLGIVEGQGSPPGLDESDRPYLVPARPGHPAGDLPPFSVRLFASGPFGSLRPPPPPPSPTQSESSSTTSSLNSSSSGPPSSSSSTSSGTPSNSTTATNSSSISEGPIPTNTTATATNSTSPPSNSTGPEPAAMDVGNATASPPSTAALVGSGNGAEATRFKPGGASNRTSPTVMIGVFLAVSSVALWIRRTL